MEWQEDAKELLDELLKPIPVFVRPMAKKGIEKKILEAAEGQVTKDAVIQGYLVASPGDMQERAIKLLQAKGIDLTPYKELLEKLK
ncbi:DUF2621 family protein [Ammoniphilus sp. CFH 90114]|uniref:DUF2621 family protein n=1 Tax=Ammoniphilus sp. CFH 90114 TaxID=2493665 RepID=UPI00100F74FE|nr:DUF2621 family protein [Ammoniphilus sp. CFH 90114]RXT06298.1 DUF2621 family protein [Ammoniphilus sp. CFH 90114]